MAVMTKEEFAQHVKSDTLPMYRLAYSILQITANEAKKIYRHNRRTSPVAWEENLSPEFYDEHHELWDAVMQLDSGYRDVIVLFYYERCAIPENSQTAEQTGEAAGNTQTSGNSTNTVTALGADTATQEWQIAYEGNLSIRCATAADAPVTLVSVDPESLQLIPMQGNANVIADIGNLYQWKRSCTDSVLL